MKRVLWLGVLVLAACTKSNPAAMCTANGACIDPNFPFCDVDGSIDGVAGACIAPTCTAGDVVSCQGSDALVCNGSGDGFVTQSCVNGCAETTGCLACLANQTSCVNGTLATCDGSGNVASMTTCAVGCSADATRCATMVPSNGVAAQLAMVPAPPDIDLENGGLDLQTGMFTPNDPSDGSARPVAMTFVAGSDGGQDLMVLVANKLTLNNVGVGDSAEIRPNRAFAAIAASDVVVEGGLTIALIGPNDDEQCPGQSPGSAADGSFVDTGGGGGGGFATIGGDGGAISGGHGAKGGAIAGTEALVPLRGGCDGGNRAARGTIHSFGGGAIQLSSLTRIDVTGALDADASQPASPVGAGGGAGGAILLEAPVVVLEANASLFARGAGGTAGDHTPGVVQDDALSDPGGLCQGTSDQQTCTDGGSGASPTVAAQSGEDFTGTTGVGNVSSGGGGGGLGRIRINTGNGMFTPGTATLIAGAMTVGMVTTQ